MKLRLTLLLVLIATLTMGGLIGSSPTLGAGLSAHAQGKLSPSVVRFDRGRFEETAPGEWAEYDARGQLRYRFRDAGQDGQTSILRNDRMGVTIWLDRRERVIFAEWPGQPRHRMHTITGIDDMMFPPDRPDPTPPPVTNDRPVTTTSVKVVRTGDQHVFRRANANPLRWSVSAPDGTRTTLRQLGHDGQTLYLGAETGGQFLAIDLGQKMIRTSSGEALIKRHTITSTSDQYDEMVSPNPPSLPDPREDDPRWPGMRSMPESEKADCRAKGGFVERAGMLGAERCTMRYSDGGKVCTDGSQCQGQCRASSDADTGEPAQGVCQANDNPFGCYGRVENGRATPMLCVD